MVLSSLIETQLEAALARALPAAAGVATPLRPCQDPRFGDYQSNALIAVAREHRLNPRQLAAEVLRQLDVAAWCEPPEVAGPGFLNFRLTPAAVTAALQDALGGGPLFFARPATPRTLVLDFSSPNVAKPMHVGHIRSTILGECLARVTRLLGHRVITDNHLGDWGTQFGKLLVGWKTQRDAAALERDPIGELERLYRVVNAACESDPAVLDQARQELVRLQAGDPENLAIWKQMFALSQNQFDAVYARLGVKFDFTLGESFYNPHLRRVVDALVARGIARESDGALCVFSDGTLPPKEDPFLIQRDGEWLPNPSLIQKRDGGFNYATTDLATLEYRLETWRPDEIVYFTDGGQQLHFRQVFAAFRRWHPEARVELRHVWFGKILGDDGKPFRTRSGDTVRLLDLLDEAEERALRVVREKNPDLPAAEQREIARQVGLGALKYADLLPNRQTDYVFSWDKMLSLTGNTAPYLQYAATRIRSIFRRQADAGEAGGAGAPEDAFRRPLSAPEELRLGKHLLQFGLTLEAVAGECRPNYLCNYLYDLAGHFTTFYERCPVLKAAEPERAARLALCELTGRVLRQGLDVLGIETPDRM